METRHLHLDPKCGQILSGFFHTSFFSLSDPCCYQPVGNHSTPSSWLSSAACCGNVLYRTSASKPCSPKRQKDVSRMVLGWLLPNSIVGVCLMRCMCHFTEHFFYRTVPSVSSEELQVNRVAAFLWLGRWLNNFSLKTMYHHNSDSDTPTEEKHR